MTEEALRRVVGGDAEANEKLAVLQHLARCEECAAMGRRVAEGEFAALTSHFADGAAEPLGHLDEQAQLRPYAAGRLDAAESEIVASHLDDCELCHARLEAIHAARRRQAWIYAIAASIAIAVVLSALVTRTRTPDQQPPIAVHSQPPMPQPSPTPQPTTTTTANEVDPEWQRLVARAIRTRELPFPAVLTTLSMPTDVPRGHEVDAKRVSPAGVVVAEARPRFSWPATNGATYLVFVFDGEREVAQSESLRANHWTPAADLPRGRTLGWQVEIQRDGATSIIPAPPTPPAVFRLITEEQEHEIGRAKALHRDDPLLLAVLYAQTGLRDEALTQLRLAAKRGVAGAEEILENLDHN